MSQPWMRTNIFALQELFEKGAVMEISLEFQRRAKAHNALVAERDALAAENERLTRLLLDLSDAVHFHRANADTAKCSATIDRIVAEVDKMHPIS